MMIAQNDGPYNTEKNGRHQISENGSLFHLSALSMHRTTYNVLNYEDLY